MIGTIVNTCTIIVGSIVDAAMNRGTRYGGYALSAVTEYQGL